jgi:aminoglycoside 2'-N-acetyltransferase I
MIAPAASPSGRYSAAMHHEVRLRRLATADFTDRELEDLHALLIDAFIDAFDEPSEPEEAFSKDDWHHALGGVHVLAEVDGRIAAHASVVERELHVGGRPLRTGYVEAVATVREARGRGYGTAVMGEIGGIIREGYQLGALGTGADHFYERLGWRAWPGPTAVRTATGEQRTPDADRHVFFLRTPATPALDEEATLSCDWRPGDVW